MDLFEQRYQQLGTSLSGISLLPLNSKPNLYRGDFHRSWKPGLFLGRWTLEEITQALESAFFFDRWRAQGHKKIWFDLPLNDLVGRSELLVWTEFEGFTEILFHCVVWLEYTYVQQAQRHFPTLCVEQLRMQNPRAKSINYRELMPGQNYPSTGLAKNAFAVMRSLAAILGAQMLSGIPQYFHTAIIFGRHFEFLDPDMIVLFKAMKRDLLKDDSMENISKVSHLFEARKILRNKIQYSWPTEMQAYVDDEEIRNAIFPSEESINLFSSLYHFSVLQP